MKRETEVAELVLIPADPFTVDTVNKFSGLAGTPRALVSMDDEYAIVWVVHTLPQEGDVRWCRVIRDSHEGYVGTAQYFLSLEEAKTDSLDLCSRHNTDITKFVFTSGIWQKDVSVGYVWNRFAKLWELVLGSSPPPDENSLP
jgi:hypothetical protein